MQNMAGSFLSEAQGITLVIDHDKLICRVCPSGNYKYRRWILGVSTITGNVLQETSQRDRCQTQL